MTVPKLQLPVSLLGLLTSRSNIRSPGWWSALAAIVATVASVIDPSLATSLREVIVAVGGLVVMVYTAEAHVTHRAHTRAAAAVQVARAKGPTS